MGGGADLAMACDLRLASDTLRFASSEAKVGMGAHFASVILPRLLPRALSLELLYTGRPMTPEEGLTHGFLNAVHPASEVREAVRALAETIAAIRPETPIVLCSGFAAMLSTERARALGIRSFLPKPIGLRDLATAVRNALDGRSA